MNQAQMQWTITCLVAVVAVLATVLLLNYIRDDSRYAFAQVSEGSAGYVVGILGQPHSNKLPLFLIDNKSQTIMVYEYSQERRELFLRAARSFRYDRELVDADYSNYSSTKGPSVGDVRDDLGGNNSDNNRY